MKSTLQMIQAAKDNGKYYGPVENPKLWFSGSSKVETKSGLLVCTLRHGTSTFRLNGKRIAKDNVNELLNGE